MISLPGWCLLSRKHARGILDIPSHLGGMNLWPAFERVWAPEEVFLPTALALSRNMEGVLRRVLTHSRWDERAADHGNRVHPLSYDGSFDNVLVSKTRAEGCLFLRKVNPSGRGSLFDARHEYQSSVGSSPSPSGWYASASSSLSPERRGESIL